MGELRPILDIPGVGWMGNAVVASQDVADRVAAWFGWALPPPRQPTADDLLGLTEYVALFPAGVGRGYQKVASTFLIASGWCVLALPQRTGKSLPVIMAAIALGARRVLVISPGSAKWPWVDEIARWGQHAAVLLEGKKALEARVACLACKGTGLVADTETRTWCLACKQLNGQSYGYYIVQVRNVDRPVRSEDGEVTGYCCSVHREVVGPDPRLYCRLCEQVLWGVLMQARFVILNYDIVAPTVRKTEEGYEDGTRADLPGWARTISRLPWDIVVYDEGRMLRGRAKSKDKRGKTRRDVIKQATKHATRAWGLDATPVNGFTRDLYGLLDTVSLGLFGKEKDFDRRYCEGMFDGYGWRADGRGDRANDELKGRLARCLHRRERREIAPELPPAELHLIRCDQIGELPQAVLTGERDRDWGQLVAATLDSKLPVFLDYMVEQLAAGECVYVLTYLRESAERVHAACEKRLVQEKIKAPCLLALGTDPKSRRDLANRFVEIARKSKESNGATGGAIFVATIKSMQGGLSLKGAAGCDVLELSHDPAELQQAIDRGYEIGINGYYVRLYVTKGTNDEHFIAVLRPKIETQIALVGDASAQAMAQALAPRRVDPEEQWARLTRHLA